MPRFKEKEELKSLWATAAEAEKILNKEGINGNDGAKIWKITLRILDLMYNIYAVLALPSLLLIFPVLAYLIQRYVEWAIQWGKEEVAKANTRRLTVKLSRLKKETTDKKKKKAIDKLIDKIEKEEDKLEMSD